MSTSSSLLCIILVLVCVQSKEKWWPSPELPFTPQSAKKYYQEFSKASHEYYKGKISFEDYTENIIFAPDFTYVEDGVIHDRDVFLETIRDLPPDISSIEVKKDYIGYHSDDERDGIFYTLEMSIDVAGFPGIAFSNQEVEHWFSKDGKFLQLTAHTEESFIVEQFRKSYKNLGDYLFKKTEDKFAAAAIADKTGVLSLDDSPKADVTITTGVSSFFSFVTVLVRVMTQYPLEGVVVFLALTLMSMCVYHVYLCFECNCKRRKNAVHGYELTNNNNNNQKKNNNISSSAKEALGIIDDQSYTSSNTRSSYN